MSVELLCGWGRTSPSAAAVSRPLGAGEVSQALAGADGRGVLARGLGRSYGDAAQNAGGRVLDMTVLDTVRDFDPDTGTLTVDAGASLGQLMELLVPRGWFPAVSPGTRHVTVGGAIAADIHGKNHHRDGTFCQHLTGLELATPEGVLELTPDDDAFWATAGGMGLTGVITAATLQLQPIATSRMVVDTLRCGSLDAALARMRSSPAPYSVAWIDLLAGGGSLGRGVVTEGRHAGLDDLDPLDRRAPLAFAPGALLSAPPWVPGGLLNRWTVRAFNEAWFRSAPRSRRGELQSLSTFFHPLDGLAGWNRIYGPRGFVQYQLVVPPGAADTLRRLVATCSRVGAPSFLTVLKRFGPTNAGPLSFPLAGWTLSLDLPAGMDGLARLLDRFDQWVAEAGGRVYLAKDARLRPEVLTAMYPRLAEWRTVRDRLDPDRRLRSDLGRRLELAG